MMRKIYLTLSLIVLVFVLISSCAPVNSDNYSKQNVDAESSNIAVPEIDVTGVDYSAGAKVEEAVEDSTQGNVFEDVETNPFRYEE